MPAAGVDGYPATGALFYAAQAYSGYMTTQSGHELAFSVIFNSTAAGALDDTLAIMADVGDVLIALQSHG